ncbi:MAG: type II toxin-antitoxin system VapC family toxin [Sphingobacteriaceae bacterium]|nr:MAG: type II toxin-antitoxin system VapC family toxin [Sphingobacteriaceae bacterium]
MQLIVKVLLDTHTLIWYAEGASQLSLKARTELENINNIKFVSIISMWEIAIKANSNKIEFKQTFKEVKEFLINNDIDLLPVKIAHLNTILDLPHYHKDPFDRLLIAQAIAEDLTLISAYQYFKSYPINLIW